MTLTVELRGEVKSEEGHLGEDPLHDHRVWIHEGDVYVDDQKAGSYEYYISPDEKVADLQTLWLDEKYRGRGVAKTVLTRIERQAKHRGAKWIKMDAARDGLIVWPLLGFEYNHKDKKRVVEYLRRYSERYGVPIEVDEAMTSREIVLSKNVQGPLREGAWVDIGISEPHAPDTSRAEPVLEEMGVHGWLEAKSYKPLFDEFTIYHVTFSDRAESIRVEGFIPQKEPPLGQDWEAEHIGAYGFSNLDLARNSVEQSIDISEGELSVEDFAIVKITVPTTPEWRSRLRPDEDWSRDPDDWVKYQENGEGVILGEIPSEYVEVIHTSKVRGLKPFDEALGRRVSSYKPVKVRSHTRRKRR